jgi:hypothetical protein
MNGGLKMERDKHIQILQRVYAGVLADAVSQLGKEGILEKVTERKRDEQLKTGKQKAAQFQITTPENVFTTLSELFGCAHWEITPRESGFQAVNRGCMLCEFSRKMGSHSPCNLYCLDPMEGMIKGIAPESEFNVQSTLWSGSSCTVEVNLK